MVFLKNTMKTVVLHGGKLDRTTWPFPSLKSELRGDCTEDGRSLVRLTGQSLDLRCSMFVPPHTAHEMSHLPAL